MILFAVCQGPGAPGSGKSRNVPLLVRVTLVTMFLIVGGLVAPLARAAEIPPGWQSVKEGPIEVCAVAADSDVATELARNLDVRWQRITDVLGLPRENGLTVYLHPSFSELEGALQATGIRGGWGPAGGLHLASVPGTEHELLLLSVEQLVVSELGGSRDEPSPAPSWFQLGLTAWLLDLEPGSTWDKQILAKKIADPLLRSTSLADASLSMAPLAGFVEFISDQYGQKAVERFLDDLVSDPTGFQAQFVRHFGRTPSDLADQYSVWTKHAESRPATGPKAFGLVGFGVLAFAVRISRRHGIAKAVQVPGRQVRLNDTQLSGKPNRLK